MTPPAHASSRGVRRITLDAAGVPLSALLSEPAGGSARAVVVAVHGGGMNAGYFDCRAHPRQSLLTLGAGLGYTVLAVDRPGYRHSASRLPQGQDLPGQAVSLRAALRDFTSRHATGAGLFLLAHSYGGKVALTAAADPGLPHLLGLDISGCGHMYAVEPHELPTAQDDGGRLRRSWGPLRLYPPDTFRASGSIVEPVPALERAELARWPLVFRATAPRVRVPVRLTFAEHEAWWRHDDAALTDLAAHFTSAPRVSVDRQPEAGHNISLGWAARSYHLRVLAFLEDCLASRETTLTPHAAVRPLPSATVS
ncbi:alpha/beta hydrolase [Streptomyces capitiformicae]|uniref:Thioesterase n=1 Tax=Streptomyces capitiformicae TaxID=2014920 RepID=A0A919GNZ1_9ACTN|nr:alpha/beta fold hydrolase [Streptomyces capitiformicae]GHH88082.1 thioesterase [Streptomyces capitiformicae]